MEVETGLVLMLSAVAFPLKRICDAIKLTAASRLKGEAVPPTTLISSVLITKAKESTAPILRSKLKSGKIDDAMVVPVSCLCYATLFQT